MVARNVLYGRYEIIKRENLGEGSFGWVFQAYDPFLNRYVAIKEIKPQFMRLPFITIEEYQLLKLVKPLKAFPQPLDLFYDRGIYFIVMEMIHGITLRELLLSYRDRGGVPLDEVLEYGIQLADLLDALHTLPEGLVNRDTHPDNILVEHVSGRIRLIDSGAMWVRGWREREKWFDDIGLWRTLERHTAPEAILRQELTPKADVYSLGVLLMILLLGYEVPKVAELWQQREERKLPSSLLELIESMCSYSPHNRPDMLEVKYWLREIRYQHIVADPRHLKARKQVRDATEQMHHAMEQVDELLNQLNRAQARLSDAKSQQSRALEQLREIRGW